LRGKIVTFVQHGLTKGGRTVANVTISVSMRKSLGYVSDCERGYPVASRTATQASGGSSKGGKVRSHRVTGSPFYTGQKPE
jgi:hypothetical protein